MRGRGRSPSNVGSVTGPTYADFLAHITGLATDGAVNWSDQNNTSDLTFSGTRNYRVAAAAGTGTMFGSTWGIRTSSSAAYARMIQHALPSEAVFNALVTEGHEVFFVLSSMNSTTAYSGFNRNGYLSGSISGGSPRRWISDLIRWDTALGKAFRSNPFTMSAETEYVF